MIDTKLLHNPHFLFNSMERMNTELEIFEVVLSPLQKPVYEAIKIAIYSTKMIYNLFIFEVKIFYYVETSIIQELITYNK